ncbi:hypothetical protein FKP32DRAFT_555260 [Trametes sanguinea]|nr:hypothetical protein FKP32DRAFT_555260 [Trametes sanguinea]
MSVCPAPSRKCRISERLVKPSRSRARVSERAAVLHSLGSRGFSSRGKSSSRSSFRRGSRLSSKAGPFTRVTTYLPPLGLRPLLSIVGAAPLRLGSNPAKHLTDGRLFNNARTPRPHLGQPPPRPFFPSPFGCRHIRFYHTDASRTGAAHTQTVVAHVLCELRLRLASVRQSY